MMTIKHVSPDGNELLYETAEVTYTRGTSPHENVLTGTPPTVWYKRDNELVPLTGGKVFVMNGHGSTVSRYDLDFDPRGYRPNTPGDWTENDLPQKREGLFHHSV